MELNKSIALVVKLDVDVVFCVNDISSDLLNMPENSYRHEDRNCHNQRMPGASMVCAIQVWERRTNHHNSVANSIQLHEIRFK